MTNTRITDPEVLERRYPIVLKKFCLREKSGGGGKFRGGDGVIRELLFRAPITLSILTERRVFEPYGLEGKFYLVSTNLGVINAEAWLLRLCVWPVFEKCSILDQLQPMLSLIIM